MTWRAPAVGPINALLLRKADWPRLPLAIAQDDEELIAWKRRLYGNSLLVARNGSGLLWGLRQKQRVGPIRVSFLHIGGFSCDSRDSFVDLYRQVLRLAGDPLLARFETVAANPFLRPFKSTRAQPEPSATVIFKFLGGDDLGSELGLFAGLKDVF